MISINKDLCVGCTRCAKVCVTNDIEIVDGKAVSKEKTCISCGHCYSACPYSAITMPNLKGDDVEKITDTNIEASDFLSVLRSRRSMRFFTKQLIEDEKINYLLDVARATPTAKNGQDISYVVVQENMEEMRNLFLKATNREGAEYDYVSRGATCMIFIVTTNKFGNTTGVVNGSMVASNMDVAANLIGLGGFHCMFASGIGNSNEDIKAFLKLEDNQELVTCYAVGYPDFKYIRTAPREVVSATFM